MLFVPLLKKLMYLMNYIGPAGAVNIAEVGYAKLGGQQLFRFFDGNASSVSE